MSATGVAGPGQVGGLCCRTRKWMRLIAATVFFAVALSLCLQRNAEASAQPMSASDVRQAASADAPGVARFIRDEKGVSIIEFSGEYGMDRAAPARTVGKEFFRTHADVYDFLVVFSSFDFPTVSGDGESVLALHRGVRNDTAGIGIAAFDNSSAYGSQGVLQSYIDMAAVSRWTSATSSADYDLLLSTFAHEMQHRWGSRVKFRDANGQDSSALLGKDGAHWSYLLDSQGSVLYGAGWRDNGDGTFTATDTRSTYSPLDLYLAGLIDKSKVPPFFLIEAPGLDPQALPPPLGTTIEGTRRMVTVDDIIATEGPRIPSADTSQKTFRFGFIYLVRPGEAIDPAGLDVVAQARRQVGLRYNALTHGLGTANVFAEPPRTAVPGLPGTVLPPGKPGTSPGNHAAGLSWLKSRQGADGSFMDAPALAPRDTLLARSYLRAAEPVYGGLAAASAWVASRQPGNTDFLSRRLIESTAGERRTEDVSALLAARNADGGWGLGERLHSNPLDTALALQALRLANASEDVLGSAAALLQAWQNPDGGWGNAAAGPSRVHVSAQVLRALAGLTDARAQAPLAKVRIFLKGRQNTDGGFGDSADTSSVHDTAHASMAMAAAGFAQDIDQAAAQRLVAESQRMDGSWHGSVYSTVLALQMLRHASAANLAIGDLQVSPLPVFDGQRVTLSARVVNAGSLQSQASTVRFFDGDPAAGGVAIGGPIPIAALVGGDGTTVQTSWNTSLRAGPRTVFAVVDFEQAQADLSRQDNITSLSLVVESANPLADLLLGEGDVQATPSKVSTLPAAIQIEALVSNAGMAGVTQARAVLWSGAGANRVRVAETVFDLAARATTALQFKATLSEPGTTVYTVELDPDGLVKEVTRANNSGSATVRTTGGVSLAVSPSDVSMDPAAPRPGADVMFTARLRNMGTLDSTSFNVRYSIRSASGSTVLLSNVVQIAAGASVQQQIPWRAGPGGDYSFVVEMDPEKTSGDDDASDNTAVLDFKVAAKAGLNLAVSYRDLVFSPSPALEGSPLVLSALVRNTGDVDATGFDVQFYDGDPNAAGVLVGSTRVASLPAGASAAATVTWQVPTASDRLIFAVVDPQRSQSGETALDDNVAFASLKVLTLPDFAISPGALSLSPGLPQPGEAASLTVTVSNLGEQAASDVVVSAFHGSQAQGARLAPDVVLPTLAGKATATARFAFNAPATAGMAPITVVVNPGFTVAERVRDNNTASITLGTQTGNFLVSEKFISPNGDGVKDSTVLSYRLPAAMPVTVQVADEQGRIVRTGRPREAEASGFWQWDGVDDDGRLVQDGRYELTVRNADGAALGSAIVEVDTNRSPLLAAIGTSMAANQNLFCSIPNRSNTFLSIEEGEGFYVDMPTADDPLTDLPGGIYRLDEWGRSLRPALIGLPSNGNSEIIKGWDRFLTHPQGTWTAGYSRNPPRLTIAGGDGEGRKTFSVDPLQALIAFVEGDQKIVALSRDYVLVSIDIRTGEQRTWSPVAYYGQVHVSPDRRLAAANINAQEIVIVDFENNSTRKITGDNGFIAGWTPDGNFLYSYLNYRNKINFIGRNGAFYKSLDLENNWQDVVWLDGASEFFYTPEQNCVDTDGGKLRECKVPIRRVDVASGEKTDIASFSASFDLETVVHGMDGPGNAGVALNVQLEKIPGQYELLASPVKTQFGISPEYLGNYVIDLRPPYKVSEVSLRKRGQNTGQQDFDLFIENGRGIIYEGPRCENNPDAPDTYAVFRSFANLQTDLALTRQADGASVRIRGGVADRNFSRYWLDYASDDAPDDWRPIISANANPVWGKELALWVAPGVGRYTVRLTAEDLAGNRKQKLRRITMAQAGPPITNVVREPELISPNGDGVQDEMRLSYRVLEPVNLEFRIFNRQGTLVRTVVRNHPVGGLDASIIWDGRDDNGVVVLDGEYRINVVGFDFFVTVDNTAPDIQALQSGPPFSWCKGALCRSTELRWSVVDAHFDTVQLEVGEGAAPDRWTPYQGQIKISDNLGGPDAVHLPLADYAGKRYRLTATDLAGNRTVAQFDPAQPSVQLIMAGQILSRDLRDDEVPPPATSHSKMLFGQPFRLRPAAGIAMIFAETLHEPIVAVTTQFNEDSLAQQGEWLEQSSEKIYPVKDDTGVPYIKSMDRGGKDFEMGIALERSALVEDGGIPQNYGLLGFFNRNIAADKGLRIRLKLTGKSGAQYITNDILVKDENTIGMMALMGSAKVSGKLEVQTARVARRLEIFMSSAQDPYFAIERRIYAHELNSLVPPGTIFEFSHQGRYVSCVLYRLRALVTLDNGQTLEVSRDIMNCGGVEFKVRPDFAMCEEAAPHRLRAVARPVPALGPVPLLAMEVHAEYPNGTRQLVFNVVNPAYEDYEFTFDHAGLQEGAVRLTGTTTDRDGVQRSSSLMVPIDHTPPALRITYPLENQRVCAIPEWHRRQPGIADEMVNALRPVAEIEDAAGFDYLHEFQLGEGDANLPWQPVPGRLPSIHYPDPKDSAERGSTAQPYTVNEFFPNGGRPYMGGRRIAGELGPIVNISGQVTSRVTAFDWSGARACRQVSFYLDGSVETGPAAVDRRLFSPGTSSSLDRVALAIQPMEPLKVTVFVRRVTALGERGQLQQAPVRTLVNGLSVQPGTQDIVWDGRDDGGNHVADGHYTFDIRYEDGCGNVKAPSPDNELDPLRRSLMVEVDRTAPALVLERPLAGNVTSSFLDIVGAAKDKNLQQWALEYSLGSAPDDWMVLASQTTGVDLRKLATLNATALEGVVTLRLRAVDKVELEAELIRELRLQPRVELIGKFAADPSPFSPNGDGRRDVLRIVYDLLQPALVDLTIKRGATVVRRLLVQASGVPGEKQLIWDGRNDAFVAAPDGDYTVQLRATSSIDQTNVQSEESEVLLDRTPPLFTLDSTLAPFMPGNAMLIGSLSDRALNSYQAFIEGPLPGVRRWPLDEGSEVFTGRALGTLDPLGLDDGRYRIRVLASDDADNAVNFQTPDFELDSKPPTVSFSNPAPGTFVSRVRPADIAGLLDDRNLLSAELKIDGKSVFAPAISSSPAALSLRFDGANLPDGRYATQWVGTDKAGNVGRANADIHVDNTPPVALITSPAADTAIGTMVAVTGTASDANIESWTLELGSGVGQNLESLTVVGKGSDKVVNAELARLVGLPPDGPATLRLTVVDKGGNTSAFDVPLQIDATPPQAPVLTGQREPGNTVRLGWMPVGDAARIAGYNLYRNDIRINAQPQAGLEFLDAGLPDGSYAYAVTALSRSGAESPRSNVVRIAVKASGPLAQISKPAANASVSAQVSIEGSAYALTNFRAYQVSVGEGSAPTAWQELRTSALPVRGDVLATWSTTGLPEGTPYTIRLVAEDIEGGVSTAQVQVSIDNRAPAKPVGLRAQVSGLNDVRLDWTASPEPDLAGYLLYRDGQLVNQTDPADNAIRPYLLDGTSYLDKARPDGIFVYTLVAVDKADNLSGRSDPASVTVDTRAPQAVIVEPANGSNVDGVVYIRAQSPDTDIASVLFQFKSESDTAWSSLGSASIRPPYSVNWNTKGVANGRYQLRAVATDMGGRTDPAPAAITVVRKNLKRPEAPTELTARVDGGHVRLSWKASASSDLRGYHVQRAGAQAADGQYSFERLTAVAVDDTTFLDADRPDGRYQYQVVAVNKDDNESDPAAATALVYTLSLKQPYTPVAQASVPLTGSSPHGTGPVELTIAPPAANPTTVSLTPDAQGAFSADAGPLEKGGNTLSARQVDAAGNRSKAGNARVARGDLPAAVAAVRAVASANGYQASWDASTSTDVEGYVLELDGRPLMQPLSFVSATASSAQDRAGLAIDDSLDSFWFPQGSDLHPRIELGLAQKQLLAELSIVWTNEAGSVPPAYFAVEAWDGFVWVPLREERANQSPSLQLLLDPPYYTDRIRIALSADYQENGPGLTAVSEVKAQSLPLVAGTSATVASPDGMHTVSVRALSTLGLLGAAAHASPAGKGDVTPPPPVVASVDVTDATATVSWTESLAPDLARYEVLRDGVLHATVPAGEPRLLADGPLANGRYVYTVRPLDHTGNVGSLSNEAVAVIAQALPAAPLQLRLEVSAATSELRLAWQAPASGAAVQAYALYRSTTAGGPYSLLATTDAGTLAHSDTTAARGIRYHYVVRARNAAGSEGASSNEVQGGLPELTAPTAPTIFHPTDSDHPIEIDQGSTAVRAFSEPGTQVVLHRDGAVLGAAVALGTLGSTAIAPNSVDVMAPAPRNDLVATVSGGQLDIRRVTPALAGSTSSTIVQSVSVSGFGYGAVPVWSPDATRIAMVSGYGPAKIVQVADGSIADSALTSSASALAWHPDGSRWMAIVDGGRSLVQVQVDTGASRSIATASSYFDTLVMSPDGSSVAVSDGGSLLLLSLADGRTTVLGQAEGPPVWAPDGRSLYLRAWDEDSSSYRIYRWQPGQAVPVAVTAAQYSVSDFALSPTGSLAFLDGTSLYTMDGQGQVSLAGDIRVPARDMRWSPSGVLLVNGYEGLKALMVPGMAVFPSVGLNMGHNLLQAQATDASGRTGPASPAISVTYTASPVARPDFSVQAADVIVLPQVPRVGEPVRITLVANNTGAAAAPGAAVRMMATSSAGARIELLNTRSTTLPAGGSQVFRADAVFDAAGDWQLSVVLDADDEVQEASEDNNVIVLPVRVVDVTSERSVRIDIAEPAYRAGSVLGASVRLFNGQTAVGGQLKLGVEDVQGYVVATLPVLSQPSLPYGDSRNVDVNWTIPAIFDAPYTLRAVWLDGSQVLAQATAGFLVQPHVQIGARINSDSSSYLQGTAARIVAQLDPSGSSPTTRTAQVSIRVLDAGGAAVLEAADDAGLVTATQWVKALDTAGLAVGAYRAELRVSFDGRELAYASTAFEIVAPANPIAALAGDIVLDRSSAPYTGDLSGTAILSNTGETDLAGLQYEVIVIDPRTHTVLARSARNLASLARGAQAREGFSFPAAGMPMGMLWVQLRTSWVPSSRLGLNAQDALQPTLLKQREVTVFELDPPTLVIRQPDEGAYLRAAQSVLASATDLLSGVRQVEFQLDGAAWQAMALADPVSASYAGVLPALADGLHQLAVRATDHSGNRSAPVQRSFVVDSLPPAIAISGVAEADYAGPVTPTIVVTDLNLSFTHLRLDGLPYVSGTPIGQQGAHVLQVDAMDLAGNTASRTLRFSIASPAVDTTAPVIDIRTPLAGAYLRRGTTGLSASIVDAQSAVAQAQFSTDGGAFMPLAVDASQSDASLYAASLDALADGVHSLVVRARDIHGNEAVTDARSFTVDNTPPVITISGVAAGQYGTAVTPVIRVTDLALLDSTITLNGAAHASGTPVAANGDYTLSVEAVDQAGNRSSASLQFSIRLPVVDSTPPAVFVELPAEGAHVRSAAVLSVAATDIGSGVATVEYRLDAQSQWSRLDLSATTGKYTLDVGGLPDGVHTAAVRATDNAGNVSDLQVRRFTVDNTAPGVLVTGVDAGGRYPGTASATVSISDAHLASSSVMLNGQPYASGQTIGTPGSYTLIAAARDIAGNETVVSLTFEVTAGNPAIPVVTITAPAQQAVVRTGTLLSAQVRPAAQVSRLEMASGASGPYTAMASRGGGAYEAPIAHFADGPLTLRVRAVDSSGVGLADVLRTLTVDNTPPAIEQLTVADGGSYPSGQTLSFQVTDLHLQSVVSTLDGQALVPGQRVVAAGRHVLQITARDRAGNEAQRTIAFTVTDAAIQTAVPVPMWPSGRAMLILMYLAVAGIALRGLGKTRQK